MAYPELKPLLFTLLTVVASVGFIYSLWRLIRLAALGKDHPQPLVGLRDRFKDLFIFTILQKRVVERPFGWNHIIIFWSFVMITIGHAEFVIGGVFPAFSMDLLPKLIGWPILIFSDLFAFIVLFALGAAFYRRLVVKPWFIHKTSEGLTVLSLIGAVMITYFLAMSAGISVERPELIHHASAMPVSKLLSTLLFGGAPESTRIFFYETFWWVHAGVLYYFLNFIPISKHQHIVGSFPNVFLRDATMPKGALRRIDFEAEGVETFGVGKVTELTWKQLIDPYSCTECGRCDLNCPATNTKKPLEPQQLVHDIRGNLYVNGDLILAERPLWKLAKAPKDFEPIVPLIAASEEERKRGTQTSPEVLWSCTTCGGCIEACPVLIDHVGAIIDMRRYQVLTLGAVKPELAKTFSNIENSYNPWGIAHDKRGDWAGELGLKLWESSSDAGKYQVLFWVGCAGSYDNRAQKTVKALVRVLNAAKISYAILGTAERCTGDPARRTGNEYLFDSLAEANVQTLNDLGITKIVTACPHCFNTLKNEYPVFGGNYEVVHHTQLLDQLIKSGKIRLNVEVTRKATYHDPCYLGRWNNEYEAPRRALAAMKHLSLVEMERSKKTSMCCGAGGGQMWMEEKLGTRVNAERTRQALATGAEMIAVGCPFCMTMLEDGLKDANKEETVTVLDIAELIDRAMIRS